MMATGRGLAPTDRFCGGRSRRARTEAVYARVPFVFGMGFGELVVLVIVAIVVIGPKDLPKVLRTLGQWSGKLRRMAGDLRSQSGIDDVLRNEGLGHDIAEIRKLARGEIESVSRTMRIDDGPSPVIADPYVDPSFGSHYVSQDREHPTVGPDGFDAMPDTSFVYGGSFPRSSLDRDPLYRTGSVDGVVPDDPPEESHENENGQASEGAESSPAQDEAGTEGSGASGAESTPAESTPTETPTEPIEPPAVPAIPPNATLDASEAEKATP